MNAKLLIHDQVFVPGDLVTFTTSDPTRPRVTIRGVVKPGEHLQGQTRVVPVQFGRSRGASRLSACMKRSACRTCTSRAAS